MIRRWRGTIDVPPTKQGLRFANILGEDLEVAGGLDEVWHDGLKRCRKTAKKLGFPTKRHTFGPRPWAMGPEFEGKEITEQSIQAARKYIKTDIPPIGGEPFSEWYDDWMTFLEVQDNRTRQGKRIGIVTHNRNIQAVYATHRGQFHHPIYDQDGPDFLTVHVYSRGHIAPWGWNVTPPGVYLIRHAETEWGT